MTTTETREINIVLTIKIVCFMDINNLTEKEREALLNKLQAEKKKKRRGQEKELRESTCQIPGVYRKETS